MTMLVVRASDGAAFALTPQHFVAISTLDQLRHNLLSPLLDIPPECLIVMNEEGAQLRDDSVPHLAMLAASSPSPSSPSVSGIPGERTSSPGSALKRSRNAIDAEGEREHRLYVFDRDHLDADPDAVANTLFITEDQLLTEPPLNPEDPLHSHVALSYHNLDALRALIHSISLQRASLHLALSNLNRVMTGTETAFNLFRESSAPNIKAWTKLLEGWEASMEAISKVSVVSGLIARPGGHAREQSMSTMGKERERFLGDYVSRDKMLAVKDGCAKVLGDIKTRTEAHEIVLAEVLAGTALFGTEFEDTSRDLEDLEACESDADLGHLRIEELVKTGEELTDPALRADCFEELAHIDHEARDRIAFLVERKNAMTRYLVLAMQRISNLQSDIAAMPENLGALDHDLRLKTDNFKHLARLEGLIPAYVATVVEVVRRREFARLLEEHSQAVTQSLSHLSTTERSRRATYRTNFSGKLPWEVKGLGVATDDISATLDLGAKFGTEDLPELGRDVLEGLRQTFVDLDEASSSSTPDSPLRKARVMLDELIESLDSLSQEFGILALGQSTAAPFAAPGTSTVEELEKQIRTLEESKEDLERQLQTERSGREEELAQLNQRNSELAAATDRDAEALVGLREEAAKAERERRGWESEKAGWEREREEAKELVEETRRVAEEGRGDLERQLAASREAEEELHRQLMEVEGRHEGLRSDHGNLQWELESAQTTVREGEARTKGLEATNRELVAVVADKDRALREQRGDADLDRAVLEKEVANLQRVLEVKEGEIARGETHAEGLEGLAQGLRDEVAKWKGASHSKEVEISAAKGEVEEVRKEREAGIAAVQHRLDVATRTARAALKLAGDLRDESTKITSALSVPAPSKSDSSSDNVGKALVSTSPHDASTSTSTPAPIDYDQGDLEELLAEVQKGYDWDALTEAVKAKVESLKSLSKKWTKEAKVYRERAHRAASGASDKIAFRNFAIGDLALFLPTRNSTVPVWAAFNVSFPHHFLSATGIISDQMKSREWIVARITNLTEKVADVKDPSSNPYLLALGTKYFLLEVEPWSSKESGSRSRKHSSADKGKNVRPEERRSNSTGHIRSFRSESSGLARPLSASTVIIDAPLVQPNMRRSASTPVGLPLNATDLNRSEFAIVEEDEVTGTSPTTLRQPVPKLDEPFSTPPITPSALSISLARSPPLPTSLPSSLPRSDPFSAAPFEPSSPASRDDLGTTPPTTDFEPTSTAGGATPAFLPSRNTSTNAGSEAGTSSRFLSQRLPRARVELGTSPASTTGSFIAFPRSGSSGSSILSASMHRRGSSALPSSSSPPGKATSTSEVQGEGSRWASLTRDLAMATREDLPVERSVSMTVGRNSRGWPGGVASRTISGTSSVLEAFVGRKSPPAPSGVDAASEIMKRLKPASNEAERSAGKNGWGLR